MNPWLIKIGVGCHGKRLPEMSALAILSLFQPIKHPSGIVILSKYTHIKYYNVVLTTVMQ